MTLADYCDLDARVLEAIQRDEDQQRREQAWYLERLQRAYENGELGHLSPAQAPALYPKRP